MMTKVEERLRDECALGPKRRAIVLQMIRDAEVAVALEIFKTAAQIARGYSCGTSDPYHARYTEACNDIARALEEKVSRKTAPSSEGE